MTGDGGERDMRIRIKTLKTAGRLANCENRNGFSEKSREDAVVYTDQQPISAVSLGPAIHC
jgi:hypothetical protein